MKKRPTFITIMSILNIVGGVGIFGVQVFGLTKLDELIADLDVYLIGVFIVSAFLGIVSISAGIGMLKGLKWGWLLGTFNHIFSIVRNAIAFGYIALNNEVLSGPGVNITRYLTKHGLRVVIWSWIAIYFFDEKVMNYFELEFSNRKTYAIKIVGFSILFIVLRDVGMYLL